MKNNLVLLLSVLCFSFSAQNASAVSHSAPPKWKVLIIDGQNNHKWAITTPIMKGYLEETGLFMVDVLTTPPKDSSLDQFMPSFKGYDIILSNYNGKSWPRQTELALEKFVAKGGGLVIIHAADNSFPYWKAYNEMIGLGGWEKRTEKDGPYVYYNEKDELIRDNTPGPGGHHGTQHEFVIKTRIEEHPIMKGLPMEWLHTKDELYDLMRGPAINMNILATAYSSKDQKGTGRHEPSVLTLNYGKGKIFHNMMGHEDYSMHCVGFITLLQRGTEWVASGKVTQEVPSNFPTKEKSSSRQPQK